MKKYFYLFVLVLFSASSHINAQALYPTFDFEDWRGTPENPRGWFTTTLLPTIDPVTKSTDKRSGTYAMKLESKVFQTDTLPGVAITGSSNGVDTKFGFPFRNKPATMSFYFKYTPDATGDSMSFSAIISKYDTATSSSKVIGIANFYEKATVSSYIKQDLVFDYDPSAGSLIPDSMTIFISNTSEQSPKLGSILYIDDILLDTTSLASVSVINSPKNIKAEIYPNPLQNYTNFSFELNEPQQVTIAIYDVLGKEVATLQSANKGKGKHIIPFDASLLNNGIYIYKLTAGSAIQTGKLNVNK